MPALLYFDAWLPHFAHFIEITVCIGGVWWYRKSKKNLSQAQRFAKAAKKYWNCAVWILIRIFFQKTGWKSKPKKCARWKIRTGFF
ncbi:MAG: hypothetical protein WC634_02175 [archaeon]